VDAQQRIIRDSFSLVSKRPDHLCNFIDTNILFGTETKLIYRHYATLYFIFVVDESESELGIMDLIQVFVEALDRAFENVCELDLIFHVDRVHYILDEIIMGGMVTETNLTEIMRSLDALNKTEQASLRSTKMKGR
jgi:AP-3 complex subunit sigma